MACFKSSSSSCLLFALSDVMHTSFKQIATTSSSDVCLVTDALPCHLLEPESHRRDGGETPSYIPTAEDARPVHICELCNSAPNDLSNSLTYVYNYKHEHACGSLLTSWILHVPQDGDDDDHVSISSYYAHAHICGRNSNMIAISVHAPTDGGGGVDVVGHRSTRWTSNLEILDLEESLYSVQVMTVDDDLYVKRDDVRNDVDVIGAVLLILRGAYRFHIIVVPQPLIRHPEGGGDFSGCTSARKPFLLYTSPVDMLYCGCNKNQHDEMMYWIRHDNMRRYPLCDIAYHPRHQWLFASVDSNGGVNLYVPTDWSAVAISRTPALPDSRSEDIEYHYNMLQHPTDNYKCLHVQYKRRHDGLAECNWHVTFLSYDDDHAVYICVSNLSQVTVVSVQLDDLGMTRRDLNTVIGDVFNMDDEYAALDDDDDDADDDDDEQQQVNEEVEMVEAAAVDDDDEEDESDGDDKQSQEIDEQPHVEQEQPVVVDQFADCRCDVNSDRNVRENDVLLLYVKDDLPERSRFFSIFGRIIAGFDLEHCEPAFVSPYDPLRSGTETILGITTTPNDYLNLIAVATDRRLIVLTATDSLKEKDLEHPSILEWVLYTDSMLINDHEPHRVFVQMFSYEKPDEETGNYAVVMCNDNDCVMIEFNVDPLAKRELILHIPTSTTWTRGPYRLPGGPVTVQPFISSCQHLSGPYEIMNRDRVIQSIDTVLDKNIRSIKGLSVVMGTMTNTVGILRLIGTSAPVIVSSVMTTVPTVTRHPQLIRLIRNDDDVSWHRYVVGLIAARREPVNQTPSAPHLYLRYLLEDVLSVLTNTSVPSDSESDYDALSCLADHVLRYAYSDSMSSSPESRAASVVSRYRNLISKFIQYSYVKRCKILGVSQRNKEKRSICMDDLCDDDVAVFDRMFEIYYPTVRAKKEKSRILGNSSPASVIKPLLDAINRSEPCCDNNRSIIPLFE